MQAKLVHVWTTSAKYSECMCSETTQPQLVATESCPKSPHKPSHGRQIPPHTPYNTRISTTRVQRVRSVEHSSLLRLLKVIGLLPRPRGPRQLGRWCWPCPWWRWWWRPLWRWWWRPYPGPWAPRAERPCQTSLAHCPFLSLSCVFRQELAPRTTGPSDTTQREGRVSSYSGNIPPTFWRPYRLGG